MHANILLIILAAATAGSSNDAGPHFVDAPALERCVPCDLNPLPRPGGSAAHPSSARSIQLYPQYLWPLARDIGNGLLLANYVDDDPTPAFHDYMGGLQSYDGHRGTDLSLYNFRLSDRGEAIRAAAGGTVTYLSDTSTADRNCGLAPDAGNWVWLANGDGTFTSYYHLRANSMRVQLGDVVPAGTVLGLVGSSGYSTQPHLHFEAGDYLSGPYQARDPWHGPNNPAPSLWKLQEGYVGSSHLWVADMGVFNQVVANGDAHYTGYCAFINRLREPATFGIQEPLLFVWFQYQAQVGDAYTMEIRRPNNSIFRSETDTLEQRYVWDWLYYQFPFQPYVSAADSGLWTARILSGAAVKKTIQFRVGATTTFGPRFWPRAGRTFRINGAVQKDTLRVSPLGGPVTYSLLNAPAFVSLADSIVTVAAVSSQALRSIDFQAIAVDGAGRRDTTWYNVVDFSKPQNPAAGVEAAAALPTLRLLPNDPNPFAGPTRIRYATPQRGRVRLDILDASGRRVRTLVDAEQSGGEHEARWDGRLDGGRNAPAGVYLCRLGAAGAERARKIVRF